MIGRENFSALVVSRDSKHSNGRYELAGPPLCVYTQVIFGERALRSLSSPTARRIGLRSRIPHLCKEMAGDVNGLISLSFMTNTCDTITYAVRPPTVSDMSGES